MYCTISVVSGYNKEAVCNEKQEVIENVGPKYADQMIIADPKTIDSIRKTNQEIKKIFEEQNEMLQEKVSQYVLCNLHSNILKYYPWLLDYMTIGALILVKNAEVIPVEAVNDILKNKIKKQVNEVKSE